MPSTVAKLRSRAFQRQDGRCYYCACRMWQLSPVELGLRPAAPIAHLLRCTAEHLIARCDGGKDTAENIVAACLRCNATRHQRARPPSAVEYRRQVQRRTSAGRWHDQAVWRLLHDFAAVSLQQPQPTADSAMRAQFVQSASSRSAIIAAQTEKTLALGPRAQNGKEVPCSPTTPTVP